MVPEIAPGLGIDPGGGLVEQQQAGLMQGAAGQRQPLFPATGQGAGELILAVRQAQVIKGARDPFAAILQAVDAGDEVQVLLDGQVLIEREPLGHVAGLALDRLALAAEIQAQHRSLARVRGQEAAEHAQGGGLARAVGAEEAGDPALFHLDRDILDDMFVAEALVEPPDIDGQAHVPLRAVPGRGCTSTGRPTVRLAAFAGAASTRNTSLSRLLRL